MAGYSVLMSVYKKEKAEYFRTSIQSMLDQTIPTDDFVIVCDGPLTPELDAVLEECASARPDLFRIVRLPENRGIGGAANEGLKSCKNELVAKMDADDIAKRNRCERQLKLFEEKPELDIVGAQLEEFLNTPENIVAVRKVPLTYSEIVRYAKRRMPFNNQTVMYKKSAVYAAGGYSDLRRCEDYDLYVRMLQRGSKAENLDEVLVSFRLTDNAYARRGASDNLKGFVWVRWKIHKSGFSSFWDFLIPCAGQVLLSVFPNRLRRWMYEKLLRGA